MNPQPVADAATIWTALRYFSLYRLVLSGLFGVLILSHNLPVPLGSYDGGLFRIAGLAYVALAVPALIMAERRWLPQPVQAIGQVAVDVLALTALMYASGGVSSGFGILIAVSVAGGGLMAGRRTAVAFAAYATLAVLAAEFYWGTVYRFLSPPNYPHAGFLGGTYFLTAILMSTLGRRVRESEALAQQRAIDLANLATLNEHVIQRMQSGVVAVDEAGTVRMMNAAAARLLGLPEDAVGRPLADVVPDLSALLRAWRDGATGSSQLFRASPRGAEVLASFTHMGGGRRNVLVFLEDAAATRQRAQQLKLASLGRLTASIAHEVRNPLGAISHAAQLLAESPERSVDDARLTAIIHEQSGRVNAIVETILQLGRREPSNPEPLELGHWLRGFAAEFAAHHPAAAGELALEEQPGREIAVRMDSGQLRQVLWNLCENGVRHGRSTPRVRLCPGVHADSGRPYLDVIDTGPGIDPAVREHIFEPFVTSRASGTGLGLYVASELCESNQASIILYANTPQGCTFRVNFAHPEKRQVTA